MPTCGIPSAHRPTTSASTASSTIGAGRWDATRRPSSERSASPGGLASMTRMPTCEPGPSTSSSSWIRPTPPKASNACWPRPASRPPARKPSATGCSAVASDALAAEAAAPAFRPQKPSRPDEVGLSTNRLADLLLKHLYFKSPMSGQEWAAAIHLPYAVLAAAVQNLIEQSLCQKLGRVASTATGQDFGEAMGYQLSEQGRARARELLERDHYVGPAPVRFAAYETSIREQAVDLDVNRSRLTSALSHLVLSEDLLTELGPPIASRAPMFLYGAPGNGKTSIAEACAGLLGDRIFIPYAVDVEGQTVRIFDPLHHQAAAEDPAADQRWVPVERPFVKVGGELTPAMLGATFDPLLRFYEAPIHLKANGGIFLLDDFGRQDASPRALLNRLIVSLERRAGLLTNPHLVYQRRDASPPLGEDS